MGFVLGPQGSGVKSRHWAGIYHRCSPRAACRRLAECSLVDDVITFWVQPKASPCIAVNSDQRCYFGGCCQWATKVSRRNSSWCRNLLHQKTDAGKCAKFSNFLIKFFFNMVELSLKCKMSCWIRVPLQAPLSKETCCNFLPVWPTWWKIIGFSILSEFPTLIRKHYLPALGTEDALTCRLDVGFCDLVPRRAPAGVGCGDFGLPVRHGRGRWVKNAANLHQKARHHAAQTAPC